MGQSPFSYASFRWYFIFTWAGLVLACAVTIKAASGFTWENALLESLLTQLVFLPVYVLSLILPNFYLPANMRYMYALVLSIGGAYLFALLAEKTIDTFLYGTYLAPQLMLIRWMVGALVLMGLFTGGILWNRTEEREDAHKRQVEINNKLRDAELHKLQHQLQPHFLFNSLNSINALVQTQPEQARDMVQKLSDFLRITLKRTDEQWIQLEQEMEYLHLYLDIEKVRFGHRLNLHIHIDPATSAISIPTLILQPVVENAIKFGLYGTTGKVDISIETTILQDQLKINITNPFDTEMLPASGGTGFGLKAIRRRLQLLYARTDLLQVNSENNVFTTTLFIPLPK